MRRILAVLALPSCLLLAACPSEGDDDDSTQCQCPTPTAMGTTFDNVSSMLGATNVQDALDELAARPIAEAPLGSRLETITSSGGGSGTATVTASCADQAHDLAISGSCDYGGNNVALVRSVTENAIGVAHHVCGYEGPTISAQVQVLCLRNAR